MKVHFGALALLLPTSGCATAHLVPMSEPHATLVLEVQHGDPNDEMFEDLVVIDGREYPIGGGEGGHLTVRIPPGKHAVQLASLRQEQRIQIYDVSASAQAPYMRGNNTLVIPTQRIEPTMQLGPTPIAACEHAIDVDARAGETIRASLHYDSKGTCRPEGA